MKFCDKLVAMRKKNNLSQEQLAEKLGISRQAVSKWESNQSTPDMGKIMELCKILNCSLDELVDDGATGNHSKKGTSEKFDLYNYFKDFLDFITRTLNMFWSMTLGEKLKCITEMIAIALILLTIWGIFGSMMRSIFGNILFMFHDKTSFFLQSMASLIYGLFGLILGLVIVIHIFKIRYLDYFITIEDNTCNEKTIEEAIDNNPKVINSQPKFIENRKNKIVIRDPKHSSYTFFNFLGAIIIKFIKCMLLLAAIPCIFCFVFIVIALVISLTHSLSSLFFVGITILLIGLLVLDTLLINTFYKIFFNLKLKFNLLFIMFIMGLLLTGIGGGISTCAYLTFSKVEITNQDNNLKTEKIDLDYKGNMIFDFLHDMPNNQEVTTEFVEDNKMNTIQIEVSYNQNTNINLYHYDETFYYGDNENGTIYQIYCLDTIEDDDFFGNLQTIISQIQKKQIIKSPYHDIYEVKITTSSTIMKQLEQNYNTIYNNEGMDE